VSTNRARGGVVVVVGRVVAGSVVVVGSVGVEEVASALFEPPSEQERATRLAAAAVRNVRRSTGAKVVARRPTTGVGCLFGQINLPI
jgi:hypothetical protein